MVRLGALCLSCVSTAYHRGYPSLGSCWVQRLWSLGVCQEQGRSPLSSPGVHCVLCQPGPVTRGTVRWVWGYHRVVSASRMLAPGFGVAGSAAGWVWGLMALHGAGTRLTAWSCVLLRCLRDRNQRAAGLFQAGERRFSLREGRKYPALQGPCVSQAGGRGEVCFCSKLPCDRFFPRHLHFINRQLCPSSGEASQSHWALFPFLPGPTSGPAVVQCKPEPLLMWVEGGRFLELLLQHGRDLGLWHCLTSMCCV